MANNPTIDGVSRELLERAALAASISNRISLYDELRALLDAPTNDLREHCNQCAEVVKTWPEWKQNCLGGAPAPVAVTLSDDQILEAMRDHIYAADGGYVFDTEKRHVIAAGRALITAALNGEPK